MTTIAASQEKAPRSLRRLTVSGAKIELENLLKTLPKDEKDDEYKWEQVDNPPCEECEENKHISSYILAVYKDGKKFMTLASIDTEMFPNCCGIMAVTSPWVRPYWKNKNSKQIPLMATLFKIAELHAITKSYSMIIHTNIDQATLVTNAMKENDWTDSKQVKNKNTQNTIHIYWKDI